MNIGAPSLFPAQNYTNLLYTKSGGNTSEQSVNIGSLCEAERLLPWPKNTLAAFLCGKASLSVILPRQRDRKKLLPQRDRSFSCGGKWGASDGSLYFAGTQAAGAGVDTAGSTVYNCLYSSDIGLPGTVRTAMGVRNLDTESDALTTNFAFCHLSAPPYRAI